MANTRIGVGRLVAGGGLTRRKFLQATTGAAVAVQRELCQMCGRCEKACPKDISIREMMQAELYLTA